MIDAYFHADSIDDAFAKIGQYYTSLAKDGIDAPELFEPNSRAAIRPAVTNEPQ